MPAPKLDELIDDPFWRWCSTQHGWGARMYKEKDLILSPVCATRFALQVDPDGGLSFGGPTADMDALGAVAWKDAHMIRDLRGKGESYVVLNAEDVNGTGAEGDEPCALRVFFPVDGAKMDAFLGAEPKPSRLRLRALKVRRGLPTFAREERRELELRLNGFEADPAKAPSKARAVLGAVAGKVARAGGKASAKVPRTGRAGPGKGPDGARPASPGGAPA